MSAPLDFQEINEYFWSTKTRTKKKHSLVCLLSKENKIITDYYYELLTTCTFWIGQCVYIALSHKHRFISLHVILSIIFVSGKRNERVWQKMENMIFCYRDWMKSAINDEVVVWAINHFIKYNSFILFCCCYFYSTHVYCCVDIIFPFIQLIQKKCISKMLFTNLINENFNIFTEIALFLFIIFPLILLLLLLFSVHFSFWRDKGKKTCE